MANLCATYLTFECFSTDLRGTKAEDQVKAGIYAFQEYSAMNWLYHSRIVLNKSLIVGSGELSNLERSCILLQGRHDAEDLSGDDVDDGNQNLLVSLSRRQRSYENVESIDDREGLDDNDPLLKRGYLWIN